MKHFYIPIFSLLTCAGLAYGADSHQGSMRTEVSNPSTGTPVANQNAPHRGQSPPGSSGSTGGGSDRAGTIINSSSSSYIDGAIQSQPSSGSTVAPESPKTPAGPADAVPPSGGGPGFNTSGQDLIDK
jgi:hypothetical protein